MFRYKKGDKINGIEYVGNVTVIELPCGGKHKKADFICKCGMVFNTYISYVRSGHTKSCGCYNKSLVKHYIHGHAAHGNVSPEYKAWQHMIDRCYNIKDNSYSNYGGRGIIVCKRWLESFENFFEDMGKRPSAKHSLDRFPNNETGNYEPTNCRWATDLEQRRNKRTNRWIEYAGKKMVLADWATEFKIGSPSLYKYLIKHSFDEAYERYMNKKRA